MTTHRKLAAILSADAAGYSRLMADDEAETLRALNESRTLFRKRIEAHSGRLIDTAGDSVLAEFPSAVEAVDCAVEIQHELAKRNAQMAEHRRMQFRIGINLGDVIAQEDGTIYGDGVNVAARLQQLAEPGGICISGTAFDQVEGKLPLQFKFIGEQQVKNIAKPVRVYRVRTETSTDTWPGRHLLRQQARLALFGTVALILLVVAGVLTLQVMRSDPPTEDPVLALPKGPSTAVLPFANLSGDPKEEYFADGITEEIITQLTRFRELFVLARNTTFQYKGQAVDVKKLGRELGVRYVLEGSVRKAPGRIRVTAQLIDTLSGAHLWAETYERPLTATSVFGVQDEIIERVVATSAEPFGAISRAGIKEAQSKRTDNLTVYDCVLRAREYMSEPTPVLHLQARDCLERATVVDPNYSDAWAWLAIMYRDESVFGFNPRSTSDPLGRALEAARRAVVLDRTSAMAHYSLACAYFFRHELEQFAAEAEQTLTLNPNNALVLADFASLLGYLGHLDRSMAMTRKAMALNPHHPTWYYATVFNYHYHKSEYEEALAAALRWNQPEFYWNQVHLAQAYAQLGRTQEARRAVAELLKLYPDFPSKARHEYGLWNCTKEMTEHELEGLRKAGLEIPLE
jgi:adenylate cyclase